MHHSCVILYKFCILKVNADSHSTYMYIIIKYSAIVHKYDVPIHLMRFGIAFTAMSLYLMQAIIKVNVNVLPIYIAIYTAIFPLALVSVLESKLVASPMWCIVRSRLVALLFSNLNGSQVYFFAWGIRSDGSNRIHHTTFWSSSLQANSK